MISQSRCGYREPYESAVLQCSAALEHCSAVIFGKNQMEILGVYRMSLIWNKLDLSVAVSTALAHKLPRQLEEVDKTLYLV